MGRLCLGNNFLDQAITAITDSAKQSLTVTGTFEFVLKTAQAHLQTAILFRFPTDAEDQIVATDNAFLMVQHFPDECGFEAGETDLDILPDKYALIIVEVPGFCDRPGSVVDVRRYGLGVLE